MTEKKNYMLTVIMLCLLLLSVAYVGRKAYVFGAKKACFNSDSKLNEEFVCEKREKTESKQNFTEWLIQPS
jgi:hypothetical protein